MKRLDESTWHQLKAAFVAGGSLRGLARAAGIPAGTVLARSKREGWSQAKQEALRRAGLSNGLESGNVQSQAISQSIGDEMAERAQRHVQRMGGLIERLGQHAEKLAVAELWESTPKLDAFDRLARRNYGLDSQAQAVVVNVLCSGGFQFEPANASFVG